jgi:hypothetical protein
MDKIRLLLRSVYLKGHQDGNLKKADMSWEDKIVEDIDNLYRKHLQWRRNPDLIRDEGD